MVVLADEALVKKSVCYEKRTSVVLSTSVQIIGNGIAVVAKEEASTGPLHLLQFSNRGNANPTGFSNNKVRQYHRRPLHSAFP